MRLLPRMLMLVVLALSVPMLGFGCDGGSETPDAAAGEDAGGVDGAVRDAGEDATPSCTTDADGDGHLTIECGGDDCDDDDADRYPDNVEVCDAGGDDEDCDASTLGRDVDGDGAVAIACCNLQAGGALLCGTDCDDASRDISPTAPEACNGVDDDCDFMTDEAGGAWRADCDRDGFGDAVASATSDCTAPTAAPTCPATIANCGAGSCTTGVWLSVGNDCDDADGDVHPGVPERCDGVDQDCNGTLDDPVGADADCAATLPQPFSTAASCGAGGSCSYACEAGHLDCRVEQLGCESLPTEGHACGACGADCAGRTCVSGACASTVDAIAAGAAHTCVVRDSGTVSCWGLHNGRQLGDGVAHYECGHFASCTNLSRQPVTVTGLMDAVEVAGGGAHTCARRAGGTVVCWGSAWAGQIGDGVATRPACTSMDGWDFPCELAPVEVAGVTDAIAIAAGEDHACAIEADGAVVCWGNNASGELGDGASAHDLCVRSSFGSMFDCALAPITVPGITTAVEIAAAGSHSCARLASGEVRCWGINFYGQLGDGTRTARTAPVAVSGLTDAIQIDVGSDNTNSGPSSGHTCAVRASGNVVCWGHNHYGQLGDGASHGACSSFPEDCSPMPVTVASLTDAVEVAASSVATCARRAGGTVVCWGQGFGPTPAAVAGLSDATSLVAGGGQSTVGSSGGFGGPFFCALRGTGGVYCWGQNEHGQLGDGTYAEREAPTPISDP